MNMQPVDELLNRERLTDLAQSAVFDAHDLWPRIERSVRDLQPRKAGLGTMRRNMVVAFGSVVAVGVLLGVLVVPQFLSFGRSGEASLFFTPGGAVDKPIYSSIEELSAASDLVVLGVVEGVVGREIDYGTAEPDERHGQGVPIVFYEVKVTETLRGEAGGTIILGGPDVDQVSMGEEATALRSGQQVLLFLKEETTEDAPGITTYDRFYVTVSLDNGVFDRVDDDSVQPRMPEVFEVARYSLEEVRGRVQR